MDLEDKFKIKDIIEKFCNLIGGNFEVDGKFECTKYKDDTKINIILNEDKLYVNMKGERLFSDYEVKGIKSCEIEKEGGEVILECEYVKSKGPIKDFSAGSININYEKGIDVIWLSLISIEDTNIDMNSRIYF